MGEKVAATEKWVVSNQTKGEVLYRYDTRLDALCDFGPSKTVGYEGSATGPTGKKDWLAIPAKAWGDNAEREYWRLMRAADPYRVNELRPSMEQALFLYPPVYIALTALNQLGPKKYFAPAYAAGVAVTLGPVFLQ